MSCGLLKSLEFQISTRLRVNALHVPRRTPVLTESSQYMATDCHALQKTAMHSLPCTNLPTRLTGSYIYQNPIKCLHTTKTYRSRSALRPAEWVPADRSLPVSKEFKGIVTLGGRVDDVDSAVGTSSINGKVCTCAVSAHRPQPVFLSMPI